MIELLSIDEISVISDWAELNVVYNFTSLSKAKLVSLLEHNGYDKDTDYEGDALFDSILQELEKRQLLYGNNPPYDVSKGIIIPLINWTDFPEYLLCLIFSYWGAANSHAGTKLFEHISDIALKNYLNGETIILGFPNIENLPSQLDNLATLLIEERGAKNPPVHAKDRGIDVIGWKSFSDGRKGQIIVLMQCAAGRNWNLKKQILIDVWSQYINWNFYTTIPSMSITEILPIKKWSDATETYGIIFDRARIYKNLYTPNTSIEENLRAGVIQWCSEKLK